MNILGIYGAFDWNARESYHPSLKINTWVHDSGVTLIKNGNHICSISEERLSRIKYDGNFPEKSIDYCLSIGNLEKEDIDLICIPSMGVDIFFKQLEDGIVHEKIKSIFPNAKIKIISHHLCHASSSIFSSNFNEGTFLVLDEGGTKIFDAHKFHSPLFENNSIGYFNKSKNILNIFPGIDCFNTFGNYYSKLSSAIYGIITGAEYEVIKENPITRNATSGKIMGLSAYGSWSDHEWKDYQLSSDYHMPYITFNNYFSNKKNIFTDIYSFKSPEDMSAILQKNFESALLDYVMELKKSTYLYGNVCFSGGCFLNILSNSLIKTNNVFENVHIPPYTDDAGLHFGAACYGAFLNRETIKLSENLALVGKEYTNEEILKEINKHNVTYEKYNNFLELCKVASSYIYDNKIIGWFQNKSEFGQRALGARSLLMNPTPKENKDIMNIRVKHRENWRPFAGIILDRYFHEYFKENFKSDYMVYSFTLKEEKIEQVRSIAHVDNTCRVQTVNEKLNFQITQLLEEYKKISGIPILLNTSFNDNGEPIVETPKDAILSFLNMDIDYLIIGNFIVSKNKNKLKNKIVYN